MWLEIPPRLLTDEERDQIESQCGAFAITQTHLIQTDGETIQFTARLQSIADARLFTRTETLRGISELLIGGVLILLGLIPIVLTVVHAKSTSGATFALAAIVIYTALPMLIGVGLVIDVLNAHRYVFIEVRTPKHRRRCRVPKNQSDDAESFVTALCEAMGPPQLEL